MELDPIRALVWSAIVNGVIAVPMMAVMMCIGQSKQLMGKLTIGGPLRVLGWAATGVMGLAVLFMLVTSF
jgi:Mn2+/Fe2+ NRAMP family transporter